MRQQTSDSTPFHSFARVERDSRICSLASLPSRFVCKNYARQSSFRDSPLITQPVVIRKLMLHITRGIALSDCHAPRHLDPATQHRGPELFRQVVPCLALEHTRLCRASWPVLLNGGDFNNNVLEASQLATMGSGLTSTNISTIRVSHLHEEWPVLWPALSWPTPHPRIPPILVCLFRPWATSSNPTTRFDLINALIKTA